MQEEWAHITTDLPKEKPELGAPWECIESKQTLKATRLMCYLGVWIDVQLAVQPTVHIADKLKSLRNPLNIMSSSAYYYFNL